MNLINFIPTCAVLSTNLHRQAGCLILHCFFFKENRNSNFFNETMGEIYSLTGLIIFGMLGNILVILSIRSQKKNVLKNNYYVVSHLSICDLGVLTIYFLNTVALYWPAESLSVRFHVITCHVYVIGYVFQLAGVNMMLVISLIRYRATVHPLKPACSRRKLKVVCGLLYLAGLIAACVAEVPMCFVKSVMHDAYWKSYFIFWILFVYFVPTIIMAVVYYKIGRSLMEQKKYMKRMYSNANRRRTTSQSPFNILKYIRNRRAFLVCITTVICYGTAHIPISVWFMWGIASKGLKIKYGWLEDFASVLRIAGSHSVNPLIYGILDKNVLTFWKRCFKKRRS